MPKANTTQENLHFALHIINNCINFCMRFQPRYLSLILLQSLASFSAAQDQAIRQREPLKAGDKFESPNKKYTATFVGGGFEIQSAEGGAPALVQSLPPVYLAEWTKDSGILVTVEHVARGSDAVLFHLVDNKWIRSDTAPRAEEGFPHEAYNVLKLDIGQGDVNVVYEVTEASGAPVARSGDLPPHQVGVRFGAASAAAAEPLVRLGNEAFIMIPEAGTLDAVPQEPVAKSPGPVVRSGVLAVDTDGVGPSHGDPHQQKQTSAKLDVDGKLVPRFLPNGKSNPAGASEVNADHVVYGVAPKNLARVNGGPLEVGDKIVVTCPNGTHVAFIGDFGPVGKWGEISYKAIIEFEYKIVPSKWGPLPSPDGKSTPDIKVSVTYTSK